MQIKGRILRYLFGSEKKNYFQVHSVLGNHLRNDFGFKFVIKNNS